MQWVVEDGAIGGSSVATAMSQMTQVYVPVRMQPASGLAVPAGSTKESYRILPDALLAGMKPPGSGS